MIAGFLYKLTLYGTDHAPLELIMLILRFDFEIQQNLRKA